MGVMTDMTEKLKAFVLMPFEPEFKPIYEDLIKPALEDAGYDVARADSFLDQQNILLDIIRGIRSANLIIADLTTLNPNVLYELGLCHGLRIQTILLAQSIEDVPFDLRSYKIQVYSTRFDQVHKLKTALKEIAERHKRKEITFGSPVTDFLSVDDSPSRKAREISASEPAEELSKGTEEDKGFLDYIFEGNNAAEEMTQILSKFTEETANIGNKMQEYTARIQALGKNSTPGASGQIYKISLLVANDMTLYSEKTENDLSRLEKSTDLLIENFSGYIIWIKPKDERDIEHVTKFRQTIINLSEVDKVLQESIRSYRDAVAGLKGISREINRASRRLTIALESLISILEKIEAFCAKTMPLLDEKLGIQIEHKGSKNT
jgi:hypothetical protein